MSDTVFAGPSLSAADVEQALPGARLLPPIRHGDLIRLAPGPGDRVLIVDGLFMQSAPVRHREILAALQCGVTVGGASSMGALRAAELWRFGMRGVGRVFEQFRSGAVHGDDEVAVAYGPAEDGYPVLSQPLVELRLQLLDCVAAGVLNAVESGELLALVRALPFRHRSRGVLRRAAAEFPAAGAFLSWIEHRPCDVKRADALSLLHHAATGRLLPHHPPDWPITHVDTHHLARWRSRQRGSLVAGSFVAECDAVALVMALHPDLPALHHQHVLRRLGPRATQLSAGALRAAGDWLSADDLVLPESEQFTHTVVRAFGTRMCDTRSRAALPPQLAGASVMDIAYRFGAAAQRLNERLPLSGGPGSARLYFRAEVIDELFGRLWGCPAHRLEAHARDRGFLDLTRLRAVMEPFVALLQLHGAPRFAAAAAVA